MKAPPDIAVRAAIAAAGQSPCAKSKRGVSAYRSLPIAHVVARGCNAPPPGFACDGSDVCREWCVKVCIHAEQAVLRQEFFGPRFGPPAYLVHAKVIDGELAVSGGPACWQCSRLIPADSRIAGVWLFHADGWRLYGPDEFHELTLRACGMEPLYSPEKS